MSIKVDLEVCLEVDSIQIRIDEGLFGMPFIANYKMEENEIMKEVKVFVKLSEAE